MRRCGVFVTSRELLAVCMVGLPIVAAVLAARRAAPLCHCDRARGGRPDERDRSGARVLVLRRPAQPSVGDWFVADAAGALLVVVIGVVGLASVLVSPSYLASSYSALVAPERRDKTYYATVYAFWAVLLAVPLAGNLGLAWLLVEATTAASALLVGFSGGARALEAGWKYLILTSLGLGVALLGIVVLAAGVPEGGIGALSWRALESYASGHDRALVAYLLVLAGLAAKIGWAPVHNWLPDAHSEAPPPVSAMLSAALLPAVLLVAWRSEHSLAPVVGAHTAETCSCRSGSSRSLWRCRFSGVRCPGSGCSPTRASSTWA